MVEEAVAIGLEALGICDHDTMRGYDKAAPVAHDAGLELVCGLELSTKLRVEGRPRPRTVHLLGYFLKEPPPADFRAWLEGIQEGRRDRNRRLAAKLQSLGLDVTVQDAEALGRNLTGRPHFARVLLSKGYVSSTQEAFDLYLDESAKAYVERREPSFAEGVQRIVAAGGLTSLAHPVRLAKRKPAAFEALVSAMVDQDLAGIEVYHSDHSPKDIELYRSLALRYDLAITGGSDFHGEAKPGVRLGTGLNGNLSIPRELLDRLRDSDRKGR